MGSKPSKPNKTEKKIAASRRKCFPNHASREFAEVGHHPVHPQRILAQIHIRHNRPTNRDGMTNGIIPTSFDPRGISCRAPHRLCPAYHSGGSKAWGARMTRL